MDESQCERIRDFIRRNEADAEDIIQDLFFRLGHKRRNLLNAGNLEAYIFAIARNLARDAIDCRIDL
jgi:DNA-directed RNA polymerase specialized sigma24 family protein